VFVSLRENSDTGGALGRAMVVIVGAIAELEKSLIVERDSPAGDTTGNRSARATRLGW